jgi:hypothetical protein
MLFIQKRTITMHEKGNSRMLATIPSREARTNRVKARLTRQAQPIFVILGLFMAIAAKVGAQSLTFAGNPQHTAVYPVRAQHMNRVLWSNSVDVTHSSTSSHYGAPLVTPSNTIIVPTVAGATSFSIKAYEGGTGRLKYTLTNDYRLLGAFTWRPVYQPVLVALPSGLRLYYPGAGGTVYYVENPDSDTPNPPVQICFYTNLTGYAANAAAFNSSLFISTPLTASTNGEIYFAYHAHGTIPAPINSSASGFVRINANGDGTYVIATNGASPMNCAPALSNDGSTVYFASGLYLMGLDSQTLATKFSRRLGQQGTADMATSSPTVGPDGEVYMGWASELVHLSGDLAGLKLFGAFGWDYTAAVVPSSVIPSYSGSSPYLLFSKYNDYASRNRIALLDPRVSQFSSFGGTAMREILTVLSPTLSGSAPTEWCINTAAVNPIASCVFAPNEDGCLYRWDLTANSLSEAIALSNGIGEPYVPTAVGPDGTIYTINASTLYAIGQWTNLEVTISSSVPDLTTVVALQPLTFTATVTNLNPTDPAPTGTVTFQDTTYAPAVRVTNILAANVVLSNYTASLTISTLSSNTGSHFISAIYSGDSNYPSTSITMVQKVHAQASVTQITSSIPSPGSNSVTFLATVTPAAPPGPATTGMVTLWDGTNFLSQRELSSNGQISVTITNFAPGPHAVVARYYSDANYAASSGSITGVPATLDQLQVLGDGTFVLGFTNISGAPFTVLSSTNVLGPVSEWTVLGHASEALPGQFQYSDAQALHRDTVRFYRLRSP